jgi:hypothetical protein
MQLRNTLPGLCAAALLPAAVVALSCGTGLRTGIDFGKSGGQSGSDGQGGEGGQPANGGQGGNQAGGGGSGSQVGSGGRVAEGGQIGSGGSGGEADSGGQVGSGGQAGGGGQVGNGGQAGGGGQGGTGGQVQSTSQTFDPQGGQLVFGELTLDIWEDCLAATSLIIVRRYDSIKHAGAIGPVFEIELPTSDTFINDPLLSIAAPADVLSCDRCTIGFLVPSLTPQQWVPDSPATPPKCAAGVVCGPLQIQSFSKPKADSSFSTTIVQFAIVKQCGANSDCLSNQACTSRACQQCPASSVCNP